jgi:FkbM family methyltransferase
MKYKFVDIGCCNYCCSGDIYGLDEKHLYVEPIKAFIDVIPEGKGTIKENSAISNHNGVTDFFTPKLHSKVRYYSKDEMLKITSDQKLIEKWQLLNKEYAHSGITKHPKATMLEQTQVNCITLKTLFDKHNVTEIEYLKIDVEGAESIILTQLVKLMLNNKIKITKQIIFEYNHLSNMKKLLKLSNGICKKFGFRSKLVIVPELWDEDIILTKI